MIDNFIKDVMNFIKILQNLNCIHISNAKVDFDF